MMLRLLFLLFIFLLSVFAVSVEPAQQQYRHRTWTTRDGLPQNTVNCMVRDDNGYLWLGTETGPVRFDGLRFKTYSTTHHLPPGFIRAIAANRENSNKNIQPGTIDGSLIQAVLEDREGTRWIASSKGIFRGVSGDVRPFVFKDPSFDSSVISMYEDPEGNLWFGTAGKGFGIRYPSPFRFYSSVDGLAHPVITAVYQDVHGDMWIGTRGGGLNRFRDGKFITYTGKDGLCSDWITSIYGDKHGNTWIGTPEGLNLLKNGGFQTFTTAHGLSSSSISALYVDHGGNLWIGTHGGGLNRYNAGERAFKTFGIRHGFAGLFVSVLTGDSDGNLWIGTRRGLYLFKDGGFKRFTTKDGLSSDSVSDIHAASGGTLWIAVSGGKINRYRQGKFTVFHSPRHPLAGDIFKILEDQRQRLWLTTANGLFCVPENANGDYYFFGEGALRTAVFSRGGRPAGWKTTGGDLWLPTADGITVIPGTGNLFKPNPQQKVHIERVIVDGTVFDLEKNHRLPVLPPGTQKIEFVCSAPNYRSPETLKYKYRLERKMIDLLGNLWPDKEDIRAAAGNRVVYDDLLAGRFVFTVSVGGGGVWDDPHSASIAFHIRRPFVDTLWFYLLLLAAGLAVASLVFVFIKRWSEERVMIPIWAYDKKYKTFKMSNRESRKYLKALIEVMERDKPFLDPGITMPVLAEKIGMSKEELSQVINRELHLNFNTFINRYRVEEAKRKLKDPKENQFVILKIALDVGFNSKSSFNAVFKKMTGMSPSEYREKHQSPGAPGMGLES